VTAPRFVSFTRNGKPGFGLWQSSGIVDLSGHHPSLLAAVKAEALDSLARQAEGREADIPESEIVFEIPLGQPEKIICVGVNYPDRNEEYKDGQDQPANPSLFVRFPRSFTGHNRPLIRPPESQQLDYEGEIALIIGREGRRIAEADALNHVAALTLCNDGTIRDWVRHAKFNVTQGKNFDRSGAMGPWLVPYTDESQVADIRLQTRVNGEVRQSGKTSRMIFSFRKIIAYVSTFTTLVPGDMLVCGTPTGAGARRDPPLWLKPGDVVEVEADGLGILRNIIADEEQHALRS
jgi:2-keto-4-pentenoate hydratase/2-oxohepta-3-ene-1,7-dioic acid hydratase in catechol pathway